MLPKTLAKVGLAAVVAAIAVSSWTDHWLKTRTHELINIPVLVKNGIVNSGAFEIEHEDAYWFEIWLDSSIEDWIDGSCTPKKLQTADWRIYRLDNKKAAKIELWINSLWFYGRQRGFAYELTLKAGKYWVQWDAPGGAVCLNARHPRLRIWTLADEDEFHSAVIQDACLFFGGVGLALVLLGRSRWLPSAIAEKQPIRMLPEMPMRNVIPWKRHRPIPSMQGLTGYGSAWFGILAVLLLLHENTWRYTPTGLPVNFRERQAVGVEKSPWTETVSVYVDAQRRFIVNGQAVGGEELRTKLKKELSRQMVWTVYLEADSDCPFMDVLHAMDTIQGLGAKLVWITPKTREEWSHKIAR